MVNMLKEITNRLDGFNSDNQGYAVVSFDIADTLGTYEVKVVPYLKNEELSGMKEWEHLIEMSKRLYAQYQDGADHYIVLEAQNKGAVWILKIKVEQKDDTQNS